MATGTGKYFIIRSQMNGLVLDIQDNVAAAGQPVTTFDCHGADNQLWFEDSVGVCIRSKLNDDYVLEVKDDMLVINNYDPHEYSQRWKICGNKIQHAEDGNVLDIANNEDAPGARVCSWEYNGGDNQHWDFEATNPVYCYIFHPDKDYVLDVRDANADAGERVILWSKHSNRQDNQLWYEDKYGFIHSKLNDFVIDTTEGSARLYPYDSDLPGRQWVRSGKKICNRNDPGQCLEVQGGGLLSAPKLYAADYKGTPEQLYEFEYI